MPTRALMKNILLQAKDFSLIELDIFFLPTYGLLPSNLNTHPVGKWSFSLMSKHFPLLLKHLSQLFPYSMLFCAPTRHVPTPKKLVPLSTSTLRS